MCTIVSAGWQKIVIVTEQLKGTELYSVTIALKCYIVMVSFRSPWLENIDPLISAAAKLYQVADDKCLKKNKVEFGEKKWQEGNETQICAVD